MFKKLILLALLSVALSETVQELNSEFQTDALFAHNLYRKIHGVPPLVLNPKLSQLALRRATELANAAELNVKQNTFEGSQLGETVGSVGGFSHYNGISATQLWYSVVSKFDEEGELSSEGASFTQIVWKSTKQVGFGIAKSKNGKFFFVAEYFPSGNVRHQYDTNVFQLTDEEIGKGCSSSDSKITLSPVVPLTTTVSPVKVVKSTKAVKTVKPVTKTTTRVAPVEQDEVVITSTIPVTHKPVRTTTVSPVVVEDIEVTTTVVAKVVKQTTINPDVITVDSVRDLPVVRTKTVAPDEIVITTISEEEITTVKPEIEVTTRVVKTTTPVLPVKAEEPVTTRRIVTTTPVKVEETTKVVHEPAVVEKTTTLLPVVDKQAATVPVKIKTTTVVDKVKQTTINPDVINVDSVSELPAVRTTTVAPVEIEIKTVKPEIEVTTRVVRTTTVVPVEIETTTLIKEKVTTVKPEIEATTRVVKTPVLPVEAEEPTTTRKIMTTTPVMVEETTKVVHEPTVVEETTTLLPVVDKEEATVPVKIRKNLGLNKLRPSSRRLAEKSNEKQ